MPILCAEISESRIPIIALPGGLLIGIVEQFAGLYLPTGFSDTSAYVILILMLFIRPEGIFATMQQKKV